MGRLGREAREVSLRRRLEDMLSVELLLLQVGILK